MQGKTKVNLKNDLVLKSENIEYNNDLLKNILDELNNDILRATTLYSNSSGNNGSVTLSDDVSNYKYIEIFGFTQMFYDSIYTKYDVESPKNIINISWVGSNNHQCRLCTACYTINSNQLILTYDYRTTIFDKAVTEMDVKNELFITKVIGWK